MSVGISMANVENVFVKQMHFFKAGDTEVGHKHLFDHLTLVAKGAVKVKVNNQETVFSAPHCIYIKADLIHEITAIEDDTTVYCIHALRDESGTIIDPKMVPNGVQGFITN